MRIMRVICRLALPAGVLLCCLNGAGAQGSVDVRQACTPDAMRLCQQAIPDESRVALCLVQNKRQLSPACTIVFNRPRAASAARERPVTVRKTKFGVE